MPIRLSNLTNLRQLELSDNQLPGEIPSALDSLHNLERLYLQTNQLR